MQDLILIDGLKFECIVGIHPHERITPQPVSLDLELTTEIAIAAAREDINATIDYSLVASRVETFVKTKQFLLLETLAEHTARMILDAWPVSAVRLTVRKPLAISNAEAAGIMIYRNR